MKKITENQFDELFPLDQLVNNKFDENAGYEGKAFETYGDELKYVKKYAVKNKVITILDVDGKTVYASGFHVVNRVNYLITRRKIEFDFECTIKY